MFYVFGESFNRDSNAPGNLKFRIFQIVDPGLETLRLDTGQTRRLELDPHKARGQTTRWKLFPVCGLERVGIF